MLEQKIVDDRVFLLGLDAFFREGMKGYEAGELLKLARQIVQELKVDVLDCPIEGYYSETAELAEYFRLMRTLQGCDESRTQDVLSTDSLRRLRQVCGSRVFGDPIESGGLLPAGMDPVAFALDALKPDWKLMEVVRVAKDKSISSNDYSLVGLAARYGDPVIIAAIRETVVLYAVAIGCAIEEPEYIWRVDDDLAQMARRFTATVKKDIGFSIPDPTAGNCKAYYHSGANNHILGRCVRVGYNNTVTPNVHYHWAIRLMDGEYEVDEFWDEDLWTTEMYREKRELEIEGPDDGTKSRCKREGCNNPVTKFSVLCKKHFQEVLRRFPA